MDKKCFMKINIELSPPEIWIRIRFLEINGSPSLVSTLVIPSRLLRFLIKERVESRFLISLGAQILLNLETFD